MDEAQKEWLQSDLPESQAVWLFMSATGCRSEYARHYIINNLERTKESKYRMIEVGKLIYAYHMEHG